LTVACLLLFAGALLLLMYGGQLSDVAVHRWGGGGFVALIWQVLSGLFVLGCVLAAFNLIYIWGPGLAHRRWRWLKPGTPSGVAIWLLVVDDNYRGRRVASQTYVTGDLVVVGPQ